MFYDKRTQRKIQLLNLLIALLILIPILLDFSKGFMMGLNSSVIGFQNGLEESTFQICTVKPDSLQLNHIGTIIARGDKGIYIANEVECNHEIGE